MFLENQCPHRSPDLVFRGGNKNRSCRWIAHYMNGQEGMGSG